MKEFFKSYWGIQKQYNEWVKKHWKGFILLNVFLIPVSYFGGWFIGKQLTKSMNAYVTNNTSNPGEES